VGYRKLENMCTERVQLWDIENWRICVPERVPLWDVENWRICVLRECNCGL